MKKLFFSPQDAHSLVGNTDMQKKKKKKKKKWNFFRTGVTVYQEASFVIYDLHLKMNVSFQGRK